jgi:hypothetical protein
MMLDSFITRIRRFITRIRRRTCTCLPSDATKATTPRSLGLGRLRALTLTAAALYGGTYVAAAGAVAMDGGCAHGDAECSVGPRVRSSHAYLRAMIDEAILRSSTFRRIVDAIEATDGIVYVEHGDCKHGVHTCLVLNVTAAGGYRILRVIVDARQPDWDVMASIGHELRHALEVLEDPGLVDTARVYLFYAQAHQEKDRPFETRAAIDAGFAVRNEVSSFARGRLN